MTNPIARRFVLFVSSAALALAAAGCSGVSDVIDQIGDELEDVIDQLQEGDPLKIVLPADLRNQGDTVIINQDVTVIDNVRQDIIVKELPDEVLLGFENLTGFDAYITYRAEGDLQAIFVFDGETLLLDYPCLSDVELVGEDHLDPATGRLIESFDLGGELFLNPDDFLCGDALIFTFTPDTIDATAQSIDLLN